MQPQPLCSPGALEHSELALPAGTAVQKLEPVTHTNLREGATTGLDRTLALLATQVSFSVTKPPVLKMLRFLKNLRFDVGAN